MLTHVGWAVCSPTLRPFAAVLLVWRSCKTMAEDGTFDLLPKKEVVNLELEIEKLEKYLGGINEMKKLPQRYVHR